MKTEQKASIILEGASFYCGRDIDNDLDFVAIKDDKILATGKKSHMVDYIDDYTEVISFSENQLIIPGLHDNHVHLIQAGILEKYVQLYTSTSKEDVAERVAGFAKTIPNEEWVMGVGFRRMSWSDTSYPTADILDKVIPDRPVFLMDEELHAAWLNSKALEVCGITKDTKTPEGGIIVYNENGEPSGYLLENAIALAAKYAFDFDDSIVIELVSKYMDRAVALGITSVSDMTPYLSLDLSFADAYFKMVREERLKIRVNAARNLFEDVDTFCKIRMRAENEGRGFYRVPYMKQFIDGTPANYTGLLLEDYSDAVGEKGSPTIDIKSMQDAIEAATANDISVRLHSCGDGSCRVALNAYEAALKNNPNSKSRHMIEHLELVDPDDIPRFGELGVIASIQPEHLAAGTMKWEENCYPERLGEERCQYTWPFKQIKDGGAILAAGSDCPVVEGNPFWGIYVGNTRKYFDRKPEGGWNPQQNLSIEELIDLYTSGASYAEGRDHELGTIEPGKLADIAVIDRNILKMPGEESIRDAKSLLTIVNGKVVYRI